MRSFCITGAGFSGRQFMLALLLSMPLSALLANPSGPDGKLTVDSVNLSARQFFKAYMSTDAGEREHAELYLLGVMDATEGQTWCSYRKFKTVTLRERVFEGLRKMEATRLEERAATVIGRILSERYPCGARK